MSPTRVPIQASAARSIRLQRLHHHQSGSLMLAPVDHSISDGPIVTPTRSLDSLVADLVSGGVDAIIAHKGSLRQIKPERFLQVSLVVHLSASTALSLEPDAKYLVAGVEEAIRVGADAVSVHVNLGSAHEPRQISDLARVAEQCDRWNIPLLAMMYPRGPQIVDPQDPKVVAHAVTVAADLGADLVKTIYPGSVSGMDFVASRCSIPIVVAGGQRLGSEADLLRMVMDALAGGAVGVAMGRNLFHSDQPQRLAAQVAQLVHRIDHSPLHQRKVTRRGEQPVVLA